MTCRLHTSACHPHEARKILLKSFIFQDFGKNKIPHQFFVHSNILFIIFCLIILGSAHIVASRAFVEYAAHNETAQKLREWMKVRLIAGCRGYGVGYWQGQC